MDPSSFVTPQYLISFSLTAATRVLLIDDQREIRCNTTLDGYAPAFNGSVVPAAHSTQNSLCYGWSSMISGSFNDLMRIPYTSLTLEHKALSGGPAMPL